MKYTQELPNKKARHKGSLTEVIFPYAPSKRIGPNWVILFLTIFLLMDAITLQSKFKILLPPSSVVFFTAVINSFFSIVDMFNSFLTSLQVATFAAVLLEQGLVKLLESSELKKSPISYISPGQKVCIHKNHAKISFIACYLCFN